MFPAGGRKENPKFKPFNTFKSFKPFESKNFQVSACKEFCFLFLSFRPKGEIFLLWGLQIVTNYLRKISRFALEMTNQPVANGAIIFI